MESWGHTASAVRSVFLAMVGEEPPLKAFIPNEFLADSQKTPEMTEQEKDLIKRLGVETREEAAEELKRRKQKMDLRIMTDNAGAIRKRMKR